MTNAEVLKKVAEDLSHRGRGGLLEWAIKNIEAVAAALESEEVLAEVEGRIVRELGGKHRNHLLLPIHFGCDSGLPINHGRPVRVRILAAKEEEVVVRKI